MEGHRNNRQSEPAVRPKVPMMRGSERDNQRSSNKPVDQKTISVFDDGSNKKHLPALHQSFVHPIENFMFLQLPTLQSPDYQLRKPIDDIINRINDFEYNLHILLRLPHHRFWSTVIFDSTVNMGLRSYINNTPRFYLGPVTLDERITLVANSIHKLVFKVYCRLSTPSEDPKNCISTDYFGKVLFEKKIFDISLLMDLCAVYGNIYPETNQKLTLMVETVLNSNTYFKEHLESSIIAGKDKLNKIVNELGLNTDNDRIIVNSQQTHVISTLTWSHIVGIIEHIVGTIVPISFLISLSPTAAKSYRLQRFDTNLVEFYETLFPKLKDELTSRFAKDARAKKASETIIRFLTISRCCLINAFRNIIKYASLDNLLNNNVSMDEKTVIIDEYLDMISIASSSPCFSKDYFSKYSFDSDICLLMEKSELTGFRSVDPSRIDYLFNVIASNQGSSKKSSEKENSNPSDGFAPNLLAKLKYTEGPSKNGIQNKYSNTIDGNLLSSLVSQIKDFFPQISDDVVVNLLSSNNYDPEKVIDLISTGEIPNIFN
ncbi:activating signal cointegrator 1 complex subunit 2 [Tetranychus urticae]|uniref:CUE domain-containing protein n=1 Tax=Tetranychus urticae TaxID=32264 RepID=T1KUX0_TETUR|nr:activating signal cointegrator 1 complex subunit 2 [Tetranychus urticae]